MPRIIDYPESTKPDENEVILIDGSQGNKKLSIKNLLKSIWDKFTEVDEEISDVKEDLNDINEDLNDITLFTTFSTTATWTNFSVNLTQYKTLWILPYRASDNAKASPKSIPIKALIDMAPTTNAPFNFVWVPISAGTAGGTPYSGQLCVNVAISGTNTLMLWIFNWPIRVYLSKT